MSDEENKNDENNPSERPKAKRAVKTLVGVSPATSDAPAQGRPKKRVKGTMIGLGAPSAEDIAADAKAKAEAASEDAEEAAEKAEEAAEHADDAAEQEDDAVDAAAADSDSDDESSDDDSDSDDSDSDDSDSDDNEDSDDEDSEQDSDEDSEDDSDDEDSDGEGEKPKRPSLAAELVAQQAAEEAAEEEAEAAAAAAREADDGEDEEEDETRPALYLAEYETPEDLYHAAEKVRDEGFEKWDCHTPYPVHGLDDAMGLPPTKIGYISFVCGLVGLATAVLMIQFMNNWDYPIIVGGKPPGAFPSMVPIMFELTVLLTGFGTLFGLLHLAKLPRHHHPIFESERFLAATDDKFFISIEVQDSKFDVESTRALLESTSPSHLELVHEDLV